MRFKDFLLLIRNEKCRDPITYMRTHSYLMQMSWAINATSTATPIDGAITARCGTLLSCSESKLRIFPVRALHRATDYISQESQESVIISSELLRASALGRPSSSSSREARPRSLSHEPQSLTLILSLAYNV